MTIKVRSSLRSIISSRAAKTCMVFLIVLAPITVVLLNAYRMGNGTLHALYAVALLVPLVGMLVALLSLIVVAVRARRVVVRIDDEVAIKATGVRFPVTDLAAVQVWTRDEDGRTRSMVAFLPAHISFRCDAASLRHGELPEQVRDYVALFPYGARPSAYEVVDLLRQRYPHVDVDKLGAV